MLQKLLSNPIKPFDFHSAIELEPERTIEWTFYPEGYHYGKRCYINGERKGNCQTSKETTLVDIIGRSRKGRLISRNIDHLGFM